MTYRCRERHQADGHAQAGHQTELHGKVVECGVAGIHLYIALGEVGVVQAHSYVEQEGECVNGCIRCRVEHVDLTVVAHANACAAHAFVGANLHRGELAKAIACVGRVHAILRTQDLDKQDYRK